MKVNRNLAEGAGDAAAKGSSGRHMNPASRAADISFDDSMQILELRELLDEVDAVSRQLFRFPSPGLMARYRTLVGELLLRAEKGLRVRKDLRWRRTDRATYVVIERAERAISEDPFFRADRSSSFFVVDRSKGKGGRDLSVAD